MKEEIVFGLTRRQVQEMFFVMSGRVNECKEWYERSVAIGDNHSHYWKGEMATAKSLCEMLRNSLEG